MGKASSLSSLGEDDRLEAYPTANFHLPVALGQPGEILVRFNLAVWPVSSLTGIPSVCYPDAYDPAAVEPAPVAGKRAARRQRMRILIEELATNYA